MSTTRPSSTAGSSTSCWDLEKRCTSSMKSMVPWPCSPRRRCGVGQGLAHVLHAGGGGRERGEVLGAWRRRGGGRGSSCRCRRGPTGSTEPTRSDSARTRKGAPGPTRCSWPTTSSSVRGRRRAASGAWRWRRRSAASAKRLTAPASAAPAGRAGGGGTTTRMPSSASVAGGQRRRARPVSRSAPDCVLGYAMTSRMFSSPARIAARRSTPNGEPGVRRRAVAERAEQEPEAGLGLLGARCPSAANTCSCDAPAVDTDAPRPQLPSVEHEVVGLRAHGERIGRQQRQVLGIRHGERVVRRLRVAVGADALEHGEVDDPDVSMRALAHGRRPDRHAQRAEHRARRGVLVRDGQDEVPGFRLRLVPGRATVSSLGQVARQRAVERGAVPSTTRNQARPAAPACFACSVSSSSRRARVGRRRRATTSAFTVGDEKAFTSVRLEHLASGRSAPCRSAGRACRCRSGRGPRPTSCARSAAAAPRWRPRRHRARPRRRSP